MDERWIPEEYKQGMHDVLGLYGSAFVECIKDILTTIPEHARVLDVGCAGGKWGAMMALLRCNVTLVDKDPNMLIRAAKNFPYLNMNLEATSVLDMKGIPNNQSLVISDGLVEHFLDKETRLKVIKNMYSKILTGYVIYTIPIMSGAVDEHQYADMKEIHDEAIEALGNVKARISSVIFEDGRLWAVAVVAKGL
jgi:2-polyprenyl-3-methyl-5-hydroxy-6-metoxy-1,4-benzoquinol methylase